MFTLKEFQRGVGVADSTGGIDARREAERYIRGRQVALDFGAFDQREYARTELLAEHHDAVLDEDPVFAEQRHDVGDGAERGVVEDLFQVRGIRAAVVEPAVLDECVRKFESDSGSGEEVQVFQFRIDFRIDDRDRVGQLRTGFMVVGDDDVDAAIFCFLDRFAAGDAAVDGDEYPAGTECVKRFFERFRGEAVTVVEAVRDKGVHRSPVVAQHPREERACRDAVGIVVAVNEDRLIFGDCLPQPGGGFFDTGEAVRIAQPRKSRVEEVVDLVFGDAPGGEKYSNRARQIEVALKFPDQIFLITAVLFPIF